MGCMSNYAPDVAQVNRVEELGHPRFRTWQVAQIYTIFDH
jgi:hypothetical protein